MGAEPSTIASLARALRDGATSSLAVTEACLARIADGDPATNAFILVLGEEARAQARRADEELAAGRDRGPLHGVPVSLKDLVDLQGTATTAASAVRRGHRAGSDAPAVARLREAGAVFVGKTNLHEFALGTTNEDSAYGAVRHPLDPSRSPGGSSGGSAASVLAGMAFASLGSDTGGSIRIPAAACGLVGLKPRFGEISTAGTVPLSPTLDHLGPICRSVEDAALIYEVLRDSGPDVRTTRADIPPDRLRIARLGGYFTERLDDGVRSVFEEAVGSLERAGTEVEPVEVPHAGEIAAVYVHIVLAEAAAYHAATLERQPQDYTSAVRARLEMGRYILAEDYVRAQAGRAVLTRDVERLLQDRAALLLPTLAVPATPLGASTVRVGSHEEPVRNITLRLTQLFNVTGHPAITLPCGRTAAGLPVGAQLVGRDTRELLAVARVVEPLLTP
jgi:aspartyl-tRNA(Asn)/glutamyl-tRNA(Gln) amidotransferase subunit A